MIYNANHTPARKMVKHEKQVMMNCIENIDNIAFARGGDHLPITHAVRLLSTNEIEIEKK